MIEEPGAIAIVYESMFGSTRRIAEAIAVGLGTQHAVTIVPVREAESLPDDLSLLIAGGPTHAHGMSRPESRSDAVKWVENDKLDLQLEPGFDVIGMREWLDRSEPRVARHAAFDTRVDMPRLFTGSAAAGIDKRLRRLGSHPLSEPMSFFVDRDSQLESGEIDRARRWGAALADDLALAVTA